MQHGSVRKKIRCRVSSKENSSVNPTCLNFVVAEKISVSRSFWRWTHRLTENNSDTFGDGDNGVLIAPQTAELGTVLFRLASSPAARNRLANDGKRNAANFDYLHMLEQTSALPKAAARGLKSDDTRSFGGVASRHN
jgi:hypothetical protein